MEREERIGRESIAERELRAANKDLQEVIFRLTSGAGEAMQKPSTEHKFNLSQIIQVIVILGGMFIVWGGASAKLEECAKHTAELAAVAERHSVQLAEIRAEQARVAERLQMRRESPRE